jgi:hypothetical protein
MARRAKSLGVLVAEINAAAPQRKKTYDGWIGDSAHAARASAHNPNAAGVVCAQDITHDPAGGCDCQKLFDFLRQYPHPNLRYLIFNRKAAYRSSGWAVRTYAGSNPHTGHLHVTVGTGTDGNTLPPYDNTDPWGVATAFGKEDDLNEQQTRALIQEELKAYTEWGGTSQEGKDAEAHLMRLKLISRGRPPAKALSWQLFAILLSRTLKLLGKP